MALANGGNWSWHGLEKMTGGKQKAIEPLVPGHYGTVPFGFEPIKK
jgi:hypothetical protein